MLIPCKKQETDTLVTLYIKGMSKLMFRQTGISYNIRCLEIKNTLWKLFSKTVPQLSMHPPPPSKCIFNIPRECESCCTCETGKDYKPEL
jgi:hypothetical protein